MWFSFSNLTSLYRDKTFEMFRHEMLQCFDRTDSERCLLFLLNAFEKYKMIFILIGTMPILLMISKKLQQIWNKLYAQYLDSRDPLRHMKIVEIKSENDCCPIFNKIYSLTGFRAVGFDCEWVTDENNKQKPVSLLQLASADGTCELYRLSILKTIPSQLKLILADKNVIKLGVCPFDDAKYLRNDCGIEVQGCLDIRHLFPNHRGGLGALSKEILGVQLNKNWVIRCSDWEEEFLDQEQMDYAAKDALVAIEMFKKWLLKHPNSDYMTVFKRDYEALKIKVMDEISRYVDVPFHATNSKLTNIVKASPKKPKMDLSKISQESSIDCKRGFAIRKSPLYHNCFMYAPDGELLCSCDTRKAEWYIQKGLAKKVAGEPFSIQLLFEPSGRAGDKDEGRYYTQLKQNRCVVCGVENSYLRHKVVPREYRKHFPGIMKNHQSHDVVLTCLQCHRLASLYDETLREKLAIMCDAPINNHKLINLKTAKKIQGAAKALLSTNSIPPERRDALEMEVKKFYKINEITNEVLQNCLNLETKIINEDYKPHGLKVVEYFIRNNGGILELEKMWRQHFLDSMRPGYLPALWSVTHNHERLAERAAKNRVNLTDLEMAGLQSETDIQDSNGLKT